MQIRGFEPRLYQQTILHTATRKNTLAVLPTGLGKTNIAVLLAASRLTNYPNSKILILAPTRPLCDQHAESMKSYLDIDPDEVQLFTGQLRPAKRAELWESSKVIVSTPQGLENDIISGKVSVKDVSLLVLDEAHRAVGDYSYVYIAKAYMRKADHGRILALTASPGSDTQKINEVCKNLFIEEIELRSADDPDVKPYVQDVEITQIKLELPIELLEISKYLKAAYESKLNEVKKLGFLQGNISSYSKTSLIEMQRMLFAKMATGEKSFEMMRSMSLLAEALKLQHALELAETQDLKPLQEYFLKLEEEAEKSSVKAVQNLVKDLNFRSAVIRTKQMLALGIEHPKIKELRRIVHEEIGRKKDVKIIIFNQFRDSSSRIKEILDSEGVSSRIFVGQMKKKDTGLSQKEQKKMIEQFREGAFNCLIATSVAEEGLDIPQVDLVIFYEPVPSAIRSVQRRGRTGRQEKGRVFLFIAKGTRDESNLYASMNKEKRMHRIITDMKKSFSTVQEAQTTLAPQEDLSHVKIYADYREKGSGIIKELSEMGVGLELTKLEVGDYVLSERVVMEYKTPADFVDSIIDGRLLSQLTNLVRYQRPVVIIEGEEDIYSMRKVHPNAIRGMLSTIMVSYGIPVFQTKNFKETSLLMLAIAKREQDYSKKEATLHAAKPITDKQVQEYIVSAFPGVGPVLSKPILQKFGSIKKFVNSSEKELREVELIGEKKASRIKELVDKEYD